MPEPFKCPYCGGLAWVSKDPFGHSTFFCSQCKTPMMAGGNPVTSSDGPDERKER